MSCNWQRSLGTIVYYQNPWLVDKKRCTNLKIFNFIKHLGWSNLNGWILKPYQIINTDCTRRLTLSTVCRAIHYILLTNSSWSSSCCIILWNHHNLIFWWISSVLRKVFVFQRTLLTQGSPEVTESDVCGVWRPRNITISVKLISQSSCWNCMLSVSISFCSTWRIKIYWSITRCRLELISVATFPHFKKMCSVFIIGSRNSTLLSFRYVDRWCNFRWLSDAQ